MYKDLSSISTDVTDLTAIKNSIRNILLTPRGSLPGNPRFGSDLYKVIFGQLDLLTISMAKNYVAEAIYEFEDRIRIREIDIKTIPEYNKMVITVSFSYKNINLSGDNANIDASTAISISV